MAKQVLASGSGLTQTMQVREIESNDGIDPAKSTMIEVQCRGTLTGGFEVIVYYRRNHLGSIGPTILHAVWTPEELAEILG